MLSVYASFYGRFIAIFACFTFASRPFRPLFRPFHPLCRPSAPLLRPFLRPLAFARQMARNGCVRVCVTCRSRWQVHNNDCVDATECNIHASNAQQQFTHDNAGPYNWRSHCFATMSLRFSSSVLVAGAVAAAVLAVRWKSSSCSVRGFGGNAAPMYHQQRQCVLCALCAGP